MTLQAQNNFGLSGLSPEAHDEFIGKKAKRRRKERRNRRKERRERKKERKAIRFERRRLKNDDRRADIESKRTQTQIMQETMLEPAAQAESPASDEEAALPAASPAPEPQKAGMGGNTVFVVLGILLVGGYFLSKRGMQPGSQQTAGIMDKVKK